MDLEALDGLPRAYALALRLRELDADPDLIADCVGLAVEAVPVLLELAEAKLANLSAARADRQVRQTDYPCPAPAPRCSGSRDED